MSNFQTPTFLSEEEMITDMLLYQLSENEKRKVRNIDVDDLDRMCDYVRKAIMTLYRLDDPNNPHVDHQIAAENRPIVVCDRVVKRLWSILTGKQIPSTSD